MEAAVESFRHAAAAAPRQTEGLLQLAEAQASLGRFTEARATLERVLELDPDSRRAIDMISSLPRAKD
jgi:predicted TPR repeat methyltransferase